MTTASRRKVAALRDLVPLMNRAEGFADVAQALHEDKTAAVGGAWGSACALSAAALVQHAPSTLLVVLPRIADVDEFALDLSGFIGEVPQVFPAWETLPAEHNVSDPVFGGRLRVLRTLTHAPPGAIVTSFPALLQPVPGGDEIARSTRTLSVGDELEVEDFLRWLVVRGFERVPAIEAPGEFAMHGGILDVFPPDAADPLRLEFFGDEVESIRRFDVETQRKLEDVRSASLTVIAPKGGGRKGGERRAESGDRTAEGRGPRAEGGELENEPDESGVDGSRSAESLLDALPSDAWIALAEMEELVDEGKHYLGRLPDRRGLFSVPGVLARAAEFPMVTLAGIAAEGADVNCHLRVESIERFTGAKNEALLELTEVAGRDEQVLIACHNEGERERLGELLKEADLPIGAGVELCLGSLARGFRMTVERLVVLSDHELFNRTDVRTAGPKKRRIETRAIESFLELRENDLVAHLAHGIGRFRGMRLMESGDQAEEHLIVEFRDGVRVFVPVSLIHLVQKYVGASKAAPRLSKVGGTLWARKKARAEQAVTDMAADMLRLQAARASQPGIACPPDSHWQREFEAAFPYQETEDQLAAIGDVKVDMQTPAPMDRLICGDVGYGKTEVAIRGAFKAIEAGRQVAVLVPTTVLAEQHYRTFSERMAEYPVAMEVLSRFRTKRQQRLTLEGLEQGAIDLVIGTHRLVQKDVRFKDLGLLVIDEEQRFGVGAKETLKRMRLEVDVLTMSATPIPRTLHLSLLGVRDISNLTTAPQDRQAVETRVLKFDPQLIRNAVVRELNRGGQVYFVHNRVQSIHAMAQQIQSIVPEARIGVGHGQMPGEELEATMLDFVSGRTDVLVCTTIIESGLDIPNANTIFIHQANIFGLADLHQLRGRVGRYRHRAYCYLLLEEGKTVTSTAAKRLKAIEEFSELGAGFRISMRDLEIRGAGNILGTEQSGHISAVGYELYCQLLENAVRGLKNEPPRERRHVTVDLPVIAHFPEEYVPPGRQKIEIYRKLSSAYDAADLEEVADELRDRFGPPPQEALRLLSLRELQLDAFAWGIESIRLEEQRFAVFEYRDADRIHALRSRCGKKLRIVDTRHAYLLLDDPDAVGDALLGELKSVLQPEPA